VSKIFDTKRVAREMEIPDEEYERLEKGIKGESLWDEMIKTENLTKVYNGNKAVDNLNIEIPEGITFGFLGLNGAGKTTTVRMLATILDPTSGKASVDGHDIVKDKLEVRKMIGVLTEESGVTQPDWTPLEYLEFFGAIHGMADSLVKERTKELLQMMDLYERRYDPMKTFSGGMMRRAEIARVLLHNPKVLFLDEPTRELDIPGKRYIWNLLQDLKHEQDVTIFLSSHDIREIEVLCDRVCIIHKGKIVFSGDANTLKSGKGTYDELEENVIKLLKGEIVE
jgi:ABC-2 type transport system ATP-binding protein